VVATPWKESWILGRNFDFEGGRIFDREKILKWVFPEQGHAFVSVIWAGMVGAVTGVNDQGLYISLNAAGSSDYQRLGVPSTLVLLNVLQNAGTAQEAIEIIRRSQMFITDIFVLLDSRQHQLYRIEKSPAKVAVSPLQGPQVITNHLIDAIWEKDKTNTYRREKLTSMYRYDRGQQLLAELQAQKISDESKMQLEILKILRDKGQVGGQDLELGNRRAIDPLIAAHSVVFNAEREFLFVSQGPGVSGAFTGFDLQASFRQRRPVMVPGLPADPLISEQTFDKVRTSNVEISLAQSASRQGDCKLAE
jgi:hypothetical protein